VRNKKAIHLKLDFTDMFLGGEKPEEIIKKMKVLTANKLCCKYFSAKYVQLESPMSECSTLTNLPYKAITCFVQFM